MALYAALTYTRLDVDWSDPQYAEEMKEYNEFGQAAEAVIKGGAALYPTSTATTVRVAGGKGGDVITSDGPYAETKEALTGFYLVECADLDEAVALAARIPAAWDGAVEVRPVIQFGS
ncbi:MAG: YciI family protein [Mycobacteriales bacterium]